MSSRIHQIPGGASSFRVKLMLAMMLVVSAITAVGLFLAQRNLAASVESGLQQVFESELAALHGVQELRQAALAELCRVLVRKPRIHAALEDDARDLLYPIAKDELRDVMHSGDQPAAKRALQGEFYRFLDQKGAPISPPEGSDAGGLQPNEEARLSVPGLFRDQQIGYLLRNSDSDGPTLVEVVAMPIISTEADEAIGALAIGFKPIGPGDLRAGNGLRSGVWLNGRLVFPSLAGAAQAGLANEVARALGAPENTGRRITIALDGVPHLLFYEKLNPRSLFPPAYEVSIYPLTNLIERQHKLRWRIIGAGAIMLCGGFVASHYFSRRLSAPVERLVVNSEENRLQRARAEAELELTNEGLQRAVRFSADASHQLKTPVTVLRAGLEELLAREQLAPEVRDELSDLVHQTYRLTSVIDDLLLLARADAGRLQITFTPVDLAQIIEAGMDDLGAITDDLGLSVETDFPPVLQISGEKRYSAVIVQNLLENARKYNRSGGRIRITALAREDWVSLTIGNTGRSIPVDVQAHIFERFHRGVAGENIPGHGLGLNLARELARLHGGDLRLVRSDSDWTEFEARFRTATRGSFATA